MRPYVLVGCAATLGVAFVGVLRLPGLSDLALLLLSDLGQLASALLAAVACARAARRATGRRRAAWWWLAGGAGAWATGQTVWTFYEVVLGREVPFPSLADVGFLLFPVAAAIGMIIWLGTQSHELAARGRDVFDGAIVAGSLLVLSWVTALGTVVEDGGAGLPLTLSLAYPVGDLMLGTLVLMALSRGARGERFTLSVLALGLGGLVFSDSAYVYLVSQGAYSSAGLVSSGWVGGFLFVAAAAASVRPSGSMEIEHLERDSRRQDLTSSLLRLFLPYVPLLVALTALGVSLLRAPRTSVVDLLLGVALVLLVLTRQFLAMLDNQRLVVAVQQARDLIQHQALHDALTGLPNRVLFADRLERALLEQSAGVSVLFCDLDDFKQVNDVFGHETGDMLLSSVADRLLKCVRVTDTVTRLGGDEFAVLLLDSSDAVHVAERVLSSLSQPSVVARETISTSISIGVAHHHGLATPAEDRRRADFGLTPKATDRPAAAFTAQLLLRRADTAMYAAKNLGKGRVAFAEAITEETSGLAPQAV